GKTKSYATAGPAAVVVYPVERIEEARHGRFGHTGPAIAHSDEGTAIAAFDGNFYRRAIGRVTDGITDHVFDGAAQELRIALDADGVAALAEHRTMVRGGFDCSVFRELTDELIQTHGLTVEQAAIALYPRDLKQLADERVEAV